MLFQQASLARLDSRGVVQAAEMDPRWWQSRSPCWRKHLLSALGSPRHAAAGKPRPCSSKPCGPESNAPLSHSCDPRAPAVHLCALQHRLRPKSL